MAIHCWGKYNMGNAIAKVKMAFARAITELCSCALYFKHNTLL